MTDDTQVVVSGQTISNLPTAGEVGKSPQDASGMGGEQEDTIPEDESLEVSQGDAEPADEDEAAANRPSTSTPAQCAARVEEPYDFDRCTIQIGLQLLPDDGDPAGRPVVVGVRNHADAPIVALTRLSTLGPLPQLVTELLDRLRAELPERKIAKEEAVARKKAEEETTKARREAAKAKPKSDTAKPAPKKVKGLAQAPESSPTAPSALAVTAPTFDAPQASEQISLF
jgi:hypothetical protein